MALQALSVALEGLGLSIAALEVMAPARARRVETVLYELAGLRFPPRSGDPAYGPIWRLFIGIEVLTMFAIYAFILAGPGLRLVFWLRDTEFDAVGWTVLAKVGFVMVAVVAILLPVVTAEILLRLLAGALRAINRVWPGRALGVAGLLIAVLGIIVSVLQMTI
jgi:hypothetical protein